MCAIAGIIAKRPGRQLAAGRIEEIILAQKHRGPDDTGYYKVNNVHLAMARLRIIDVTSGGLAPVVNHDPRGDQVLLYNGEIYNYVELRDELKALGHSFRTDCDSEVLLRSYLQWGQACLDKFNGMFAFVIVDFANDLLFAARDRAGEKPLYYHESSDEFIFASEIKGILTQIPRPERSNKKEQDRLK